MQKRTVLCGLPGLTPGVLGKQDLQARAWQECEGEVMADGILAAIGRGDPTEVICCHTVGEHGIAQGDDIFVCCCRRR